MKLLCPDNFVVLVTIEQEFIKSEDVKVSQVDISMLEDGGTEFGTSLFAWKNSESKFKFRLDLEAMKYKGDFSDTTIVKPYSENKLSIYQQAIEKSINSITLSPNPGPRNLKSGRQISSVKKFSLQRTQSIQSQVEQKAIEVLQS